jgi:hypothetical protein
MAHEQAPTVDAFADLKPDPVSVVCAHDFLHVLIKQARQKQKSGGAHPIADVFGARQEDVCVDVGDYCLEDVLKRLRASM